MIRGVGLRESPGRTQCREPKAGRIGDIRPRRPSSNELSKGFASAWHACHGTQRSRACFACCSEVTQRHPVHGDTPRSAGLRSHHQLGHAQKELAQKKAASQPASRAVWCFGIKYEDPKYFYIMGMAGAGVQSRSPPL